jgi:SAM-dependent methyltransferase
MKFERLSAPGTILSGEALIYLIKKHSGTNPEIFADIGCGNGHYSRLLMDRFGAKGELFEPGKIPHELCVEDSKDYLSTFRCRIHNRPLVSTEAGKFPLIICWHVIEHIEDDLGFTKDILAATAPGGVLYIAVPSRDDLWGIEDETTGHFRRYTRKSLANLLTNAGFEVQEIVSSNVPVSNWLISLSNWLIARQDASKRLTGKEYQTETSGVREIKWKTLYPSIFRIILNRFTLWPLHWLQIRFFDSDYGTMIIAVARKKRWS